MWMESCITGGLLRDGGMGEEANGWRKQEGALESGSIIILINLKYP